MSDNKILVYGYIGLIVALLFAFFNTSHAQAATEVNVNSITLEGGFYVIDLEAPVGFVPTTTNHRGITSMRGVYGGGDIFNIFDNDERSDLKCKGALPSAPYFNLTGSSTRFGLLMTPDFHNGSYLGPWATDSGVEACTSAGIYYGQFNKVGSSDSYYFPYYWNGTSYATTSIPVIYTGDTRILSFTPEDNSLVNNPVFFEIEAYVNPDDIGTIEGVDLKLHNIDQNVLLLGFLSPSDIFLVDQELEAGYFNFSTTTVIGEGNYRLEACIRRTYLSGWFNNPFSPINDCQSHQFIVGTSTFIGNISQNLWGDLDDFYNGSSATTSAALAATCNPLSGNFGVRECSAFLFIPDGQQLRNTMNEARDNIFKRVPWGYFSRTITILSNPATTTLPTITANMQMGAGSDMTPEVTTISFDINDMVAGGAALVESIEDPIHGQSFRDVFYTWIQGLIALMVLLTIIADLAKTHNDNKEGESRAKNKLS